MAHSLFRLLNSLTNTPHLMESHSLDRIISLIEDRNNGIYELAINGSANKDHRSPQYNEDTKVGIIPVDGPLTYISYSGLCGEEGCSYQQIQEDFDTLLEMGAKTVVLDCDGPGGEAFGAFETGQYLRSKADEAGVHLISYIDGLAASATYAIASCAHELVANGYSELGSIGVVIKLRNMNKALQNMGVEDIFITAGESKIPFDEKGGFKKEFINDLQEKVNYLYKDFVGYVSEMRGIPEKTVLETEAKVFTAKEAVKLGLADSIMSREEFANHLSDVVIQSQRDNSMLKKLLNKNNKAELSAEEIETMTLEEMQASITALTEELTEVKTKSLSIESLVTQKDAELTSLQASLDEATQKLTQASDSAAKAEAEKVQAKLDARKADLALYLDAEKAEKAFATLANVDDSIFELSLSTFKSLREMETQSEAFKELGASGAGKDKSLDGKADGTAAALKAKYKKDSE